MKFKYILSIILLLKSFALLGNVNVHLANDSLLLKAEMAYYLDSNDTLACQYIDMAIENLKGGKKENEVEYAKLLSLWCHYGCDEYREKAIGYGEESLEILKRHNCSYAYADCLSSLGYCYSVLHNDSLNEINKGKAVAYCNEALSIFNLEKHRINYVSALSHLSGAYIDEGKYSKAIEVADEAISFSDSCINHLDASGIPTSNLEHLKFSDAYSLALHNKASALYSIGKYQDCLTCSKMNLQFRLKTWGRTGRYAISARNLAVLEHELGFYIDAFNHFVESYNTLLEIGRLTPEEALDLTCPMVNIEIKLGELFNARRQYGQLTQIVDLVDFSTRSDLYADFLNTAVKYWLYVGNFGNAYDYLDKSYEYNGGYCIEDDIHIQMQIQLGNDSLAYKVATNLQELYNSEYGESNIRSLANVPNVIKAAMAVDNWYKADSCAVRYVYGMRDQIKLLFPSMTTEDRELFLNKHRGTLFQYIPAFLNFTRREGCTKTLYDLTLLYKGLLLRTEQEISALIKNTTNTEARNLYNEIADNIGHIKNVDTWYEQDSLSNLIQQQQIRLQALIPEFMESTKHFDISWEDIKSNLNKDEVAVEFVDIVDNNTGNKSCKALIITHDCDYPYYVDLFNEADLLNIVKEDYYSTEYLFALIWDPIEARILQYEEDVDKVYFSPSDLTSQIALENLMDYWGTRVSDKRTYYRVSSTRELINRKVKEDATTAVVYGGLRYDVDGDDLVAANSQFAKSNIHRGLLSSDVIDSLSNQRAGIKYLPATKIEAELIDLELHNKDMHNH